MDKTNMANYEYDQLTNMNIDKYDQLNASTRNHRCKTRLSQTIPFKVRHMLVYSVVLEQRKENWLAQYQNISINIVTESDVKP